MKKIKYIAAIMANMTVSAHAVEPPNIDCAKKSVIQYYTSGEYEKDVEKIVTQAESNMFKRINENNNSSRPHKLAIVLDIDDTSISNFDVNKVDDFSDLEELIEKRYEKANSPAIKPVLRLYNEAIANGVSVFFITFRPQAVAAYTTINLHNAGYINWSGLTFPTDDELKHPSRIYKSAARTRLVEQGYDIILNLGDQPSDLEGNNHGEFTYKIPNPMYTSAANCILKDGTYRACH